MATSNIGERLYLNRTHADVVFKVDGEEIPGHRAIISEVCPYFETLLYGHFKESNSEQVEITETSSKVFKELIRFVYKGQLDVHNWPTEDFLALLALAHRYDFQPLFKTVVELLKIKPLDFDSWSLINDAAALYDSHALKEKCTSFAEAKMDEFLIQKNLHNFTAVFIRTMFDLPKVSTCNQNQLLGALLRWKNGQRSAEIMSIFQKIVWEEVSPQITAVIIKEFFSKLKNPDEYVFWTQGVPVSEEASMEEDASNCVARVDNVVLKRGREEEFRMINIDYLICDLYSDSLRFCFEKHCRLVDIPVKRVEFEAKTKFKIREIEGWPLSGLDIINIPASDAIKSNGWFKYSAVFPETIQVNDIRFYAQRFKNTRQISLRNILIV